METKPQKEIRKTACAKADRAGVVARTILHVIRGSLLAWLDRDSADLAAARAKIEAILHAEFDRAAERE